jgi:hypothetical protein
MKNIIENHYSKPTEGLGLNIICNLISPLRSWLLFGLIVFFSHTSFSQNFSFDLDDYNYYPGPHFNLIENLGGISRIADMDNDGLEDLVVFGESTTDGGTGIYLIWIYYQTANPDHWEVEEVSRLYSTGYYDSNQPILELADIDSDGDIDILGLEPFKDENLRWFKNAGNRSFIMDSTFVIYYPKQVFLEDMDNDGDLDIIYSHYHRDFGLFLNNGNGSFQLDTLNSFERLQGFLTVGDLDGDNYKDILIGGEPYQNNKDTLIVYNGHPSGLYRPIGVPNFDLSNPGGFLQDLDVDGDLDIIIQANESRNFGKSQLILYENNGIGQFNKHILVNDNAVFRGAGQNYIGEGSLFFHDIVGDSLIDIIYQSNIYGFSKVFENKGANIFTVSQSLPFNLLSRFISFSEGDLDNDGADELVKIHRGLYLGRAPGDHVKIEVYQRDTNREWIVTGPIINNMWSSVEEAISLVDINNDGFSDLILKEEM